MTVLAMVETMRAEGHSALVHTAAASNLGQMLNCVCIEEGVELVNIVRKPEQETILRDLGARIICNSSADTFFKDLTGALVKTGATLAFDATGGGKLASQILTCMEAAAAQKMTAYNRYGSDVYKQVYIYGGLDRSPTILTLRGLSPERNIFTRLFASVRLQLLKTLFETGKTSQQNPDHDTSDGPQQLVVAPSGNQ
jgi:hypothetical protein